MIRGLYIAASSAISENKRIDVISNNIANVNTSGYKKDTLVTESFPDILIKRTGSKDIGDVTAGGRGGGNVSVEKGASTYSATAKTGYFNVQTPEGISKGKSVTFMVNDKGYLTTPKGDYVLGTKGPIFAGSQDILVNEKGEISAGGSVIDRLKVSNPTGVIGNLSYGVHVDQVYTDFTQGDANKTGNPLDLALQGTGFFAIETPQGEQYTRNGEFTLNSQGYLTTKEGYKVLGQQGPIQVSGSSVLINEQGQIFDGKNEIDTLKLVDFKDYKLLQKTGDTLYKDLSGNGDNMKKAVGLVEQGYTEGSNVNSVKQMVEMITVLRSYEANQKIIKTHDELLDKAVNEIGRI
jgi:flagellar basal-body rod protein FlgF